MDKYFIMTYFLNFFIFKKTTFSMKIPPRNGFNPFLILATQERPNPKRFKSYSPCVWECIHTVKSETSPEALLAGRQMQRLIISGLCVANPIPVALGRAALTWKLIRAGSWHGLVLLIQRLKPTKDDTPIVTDTGKITKPPQANAVRPQK